MRKKDIIRKMIQKKETVRQIIEKLEKRISELERRMSDTEYHLLMMAAWTWGKPPHWPAKPSRPLKWWVGNNTSEASEDGMEKS